MFAFQCLLVSLCCVVSGNEFPLYGSQFGWYVMGRPLVGGLICGLIFGDVAAGVTLGAAVQLVYLAVVTPGGSVPVDVSFISYPAMAIAIVGKMDSGSAIALASTVGVLGSFVLQGDIALGSFFHKSQDRAIESGDMHRVNRTILLYPQLVKVLVRGIPCFVAVYFGADYVASFMASLPPFVQEALLSLGAVLPAVGIATLLVQSMRDNAYILFFVLGFVGIEFMGLNILALTVVAGAFAYLYYRSGQTGKPEVAAQPAADDDDEEVL